MSDYGRRIVVDASFDAVVRDLSRRLREQGLEIVSLTDARDRFRRFLEHDFRRYVLLEAWSPDLAFEALRETLDAGTILPTTFAIYELADGETAVVAGEPLAPVTGDSAWRHDAAGLEAVARRECQRVATALDRVRRGATRRARVPTAA